MDSRSGERLKPEAEPQSSLLALQKAGDYVARVKSHFAISLTQDEEITGEELVGDDPGSADYETALQLVERADDLRGRLLDAVIPAMEKRVEEKSSELRWVAEQIAIAEREHDLQLTEAKTAYDALRQEPIPDNALLFSGVKAAIAAVIVWLLMYAIAWLACCGVEVDEQKVQSFFCARFWSMLFLAVAGTVTLHGIILVPRRRRIPALNARVRLERDATVETAEAQWQRESESLHSEQESAEKMLGQLKKAIDGCTHLRGDRRPADGLDG